MYSIVDRGMCRREQILAAIHMKQVYDKDRNSFTEADVTDESGYIASRGIQEAGEINSAELEEMMSQARMRAESVPQKDE